MAVTYVTPVFEAEVPLLLLQARSLARHVPPGDDVVVLDNTRRGLRDQPALLAAYGAHAPHVEILRPRDVCAMPPAPGWSSQQVLKLAVAARVLTPHYVALDAKNHFVAAPAARYFVGDDGRARVRATAYTTHNLRPKLELVCAYLGLDPAPLVPRFSATVTPFTLDRDTVLAMTADVEARAGRPFAREFIARGLTEFFLYSGWVLRRDGSLDAVMDLVDQPNPMVWPGRATAAGVRAAIDEAAGAPVFGVHRRAIPRLDDDAVALLAQFWAARGLVDDEAAGVALLRGLQARHRRDAALQRVRDLPGKAVKTALRLRA